MILKRIILFIYFSLVIATFTNTALANNFEIGIAEIFFGVILPGFAFWQLHLWFIKRDKERDRTWVYWVIQLFYIMSLLFGVGMLVTIYLDPAQAVIWYLILPLAQGFIFLMALAVMSHIAVFANPKN